jgi:3-oxosteroid 1-dehydrogenase
MAMDYLAHITKGRTVVERLEAYIESAPQMLRFLTERTRAEFVAMDKYPDYYPDAPGGRPGGRTLEAKPYNALKLGAEEFARLRPSHPQETVLGKYAITAAEAHKLVSGSWMVAAVRMLAYHTDFRARRLGKRDCRLALGNALIGRLRHSLLDQGVPLLLEHTVKALIEQSGRVAGVVAKRADGTETRIAARKAVILAAGGFPRNKTLRAAHLPNPTDTEWSAASPQNTGDAIAMAQALGAGVDLMEDAWWTPVTRVPGKSYCWILVVEKSMPGSIMVDGAGRRFVNESAPYIDIVNGIYDAHHDDPADGASAVPTWLIFDATYRAKYPCGPLPPGKFRPDEKLRREFREEFLNREDSLPALAKRIGVDAEGLVATVERFNTMAQAGKDTDFGRGESLYDRYYSDLKVTPNSCLAPLTKPPYYAIAVYPGDLGTKGGLTTSPDGEVLREDGSVVIGLYATGNCSASVMGNTYPGAGGTIGPAMTFGYRAVLHATRAG